MNTRYEYQNLLLLHICNIFNAKSAIFACSSDLLAHNTRAEREAVTRAHGFWLAIHSRCILLQKDPYDQS